MEKPNIIVIYPDQLRRSALGCYGDPNVNTPNIDRLAREGVKFEHAYSVYPVCVPARFSMLTGKYPHTRLIPRIEWRMSPCEHTIAHEMNEAGYETCYIGKWHLYGGFARGDKNLQKRIGTTFIPPDYRGGFKKWRGFDLRNNHFDTFYHVDNDPEMRHIDGYQTDGLFDVALKYLREERDFTKPFFMILSVEAPHPPFQAPDEFITRFEDKELILPVNTDFDQVAKTNTKKDAGSMINNYKNYYAMIENLDYNTGKLMSFLEEEGLRENTVIILNSDHGELMGSHGLTGKELPYEESAGVPLIITYPQGCYKPGRVIDFPNSTIDLYPTLQDIAGIQVTDNPGLSLLAAMREEEVHNSVQRNGIMLEYVARNPSDGVYSPNNWRALRSERYKYTVIGPSHAARPWQLFDLIDDPYEMNNLINEPSCRSILEELDRELRKMIKQTGDDYEIENLF